MNLRNFTFCVHETLNEDDITWKRFYVVYEYNGFGTRRIATHPIETTITELRRLYPGIWGAGHPRESAL